MKLQPDLIVAEPLAGQPGPCDGVFAFFDVLLGCAALIIELNQLFGGIGYVGYDKAEAREQLSGMPLDFSNNLTRFVL